MSKRNKLQQFSLFSAHPQTDFAKILVADMQMFLSLNRYVGVKDLLVWQSFITSSSD